MKKIIFISCIIITTLSILIYSAISTLMVVIAGSSGEDTNVSMNVIGTHVIAQPYYVTAEFGVCGCAYVCEKCHYAIDLVSTNPNPYIFAYADGTVIGNGYDYAGAVMVEIDHGNNLYTWYIHMEEGTTKHLKVGNKIKKGEYIGIMGNTGFSFGAHLHFQVNVGCNMTSCAVNPASYISTKPDPPKEEDNLDKFGTE